LKAEVIRFLATFGQLPQKFVVWALFCYETEHNNAVWIYSFEETLAEFQEIFPMAWSTKKFWTAQEELLIILDKMEARNVKKVVGRQKYGLKNSLKCKADCARTTQNICSTFRITIEYSFHNNRILKQDLHLYPYILQVYQELLPADPADGLEFSTWFVNILENDERALSKTFFTDEAYSHLSGYVNSQNMRMQSAESPHYYVKQPLHPQKIDMWVATSQGRSIGLIFF
jgi:hypothetical protein